MCSPSSVAARLFFAAGLSPVACGGANELTAAKRPFSGTFALQTIDNAVLPFVPLDLGDTKFVVLADTLRFSPDGTVTETNVSATTINGVGSTTRQVGQGRFVADTSVIVSWAGSGTYSYRLTADGLSVFEPVFRNTWRYRRVGV